METIHNFSKGMMQDAGKAFNHNGYYFRMLNGSIITSEGLNSGEPTGFEGNVLFFTLPGVSDVYTLSGFDTTFDLTVNTLTDTFTGSAFSTNEAFFEELKDFILNSFTLSPLKLKVAYNTNFFYIYSELPSTLTITASSANITLNKTQNAITSGIKPMGWCTIRDDIYVFSTNTTSSNPNSLGQIWKITYDKNTLVNTVTLIYNNYLNFSLAYPIANPGMIEGRYENINIQKIYFTDNFNDPRVINTVDPNVFALDPSRLSITPIVDQSFPVLQEILQTGNLQAGKHQAAYRLKNINGQETNISTLSALTNITDFSETSDLIADYQGSTNVLCPKSLKYRIQGLDTDYDRIEIIHIYKKNFNSSPIINIVIDEPLNSSTYEFTITGNETTLAVTLLELTTSITSFKRVGTLASKKNYLFLGNIRSKILDLDYDARAYRYTQINNWADPLIAETYSDPNDINPNQEPEELAYLFQNNGTTIGGSGPNISYKFIHQPLIADQDFVSGTDSVAPHRDLGKFNTPLDLLAQYQQYTSINTFPDFTSPYMEVVKGYKRGEIYRFGIVFYDLQGSPGFVKWIADIKIPSIYMPTWTGSTYNGRTSVYPLADLVGTTAKVYSLGLEFTVNIPNSIKSQISGFSIVRCERKQEDKTILGQGAVFPTYDHGSIYVLPENSSGFNASTASEDYSKDFMTFNSPEFLFSQYPGFVQGDTLEIVDLLNTDVTKYLVDQDGNAVNAFGTAAFMLKNYNSKGTLSPITASTSNNPYSLTEGLQMDSYHGFSNPYTVQGIAINNKAQSISPYGGKTLLLKGNFNNFSSLPGGDRYYDSLNDNLEGTYDFYIGDLKRNLGNSQYGGNTNSQKSNSEYINCSEIIPVNTDSSYVFKVFQGDTFVCIFDNIKAFLSTSSLILVTQYHHTRLFPVETSINTNIRIDYDSGISGDKRVPNRENLPFNNSGLDRAEHFSYNFVFSEENNLKKFFPKSDVFQENTEFDTRIYRSEQKIDGELIDSWTSFKANNFIDLEKKHGPLNSLIHLGNELLCWQDKAFATASVDEKSVLQDSSGVSLVLGTGGVLDRFDYKSSEIGSRHKFSLIKGINSVIFYDQNNKQFYLYSGTLKPLLNLTSFFNKRLLGTVLEGDNPFLDMGITGSYDPKYKNFYITGRTIHNASDAKGLSKAFTISWNPEIDNFHSEHSFVPNMYISTSDHVITFDIQNPNKAYIHNQENYCNYYGVQYPFELEFISNEGQVEKIWDNIVLNTECLGKIQTPDQVMYTIDQNRSFDSYQVNNDYQNTNIVPLILNNTLKKLKRAWNIAIQGNRVKNGALSIYSSANLYTYPDRKAIPDRIKSNEIHVKLVSNMVQKFKLTLKSLIIKYRINSN